MDYSTSREVLLQEFGKYRWEGAVADRQWHRWRYVADPAVPPYGAEIQLRFPGLKTKLYKQPARYDFRVDILRADSSTTPSHASVIADIHNKCLLRPDLVADLTLLLHNMFPDSDGDPLDETRHLSDYSSLAPPGPDLLKAIAHSHAGLGKIFKPAANERDLSVPELIAVVKWITLQEDINYPMEQGFEGRRMPFARYIEAVHSAASGRSIEEVVERALMHRRLQLWEGVEYGVIAAP
ncbi:MAG: hypothetical protein ABIE42_02740 [Candidatus Eisenbacteria bacterium]